MELSKEYFSFTKNYKKNTDNTVLVKKNYTFFLL